MQRHDDKWNPIRPRSSSIDEFTSLLTVNGIIVLTLICLALSSPSASEWISAAAQAEFVGNDIPEATPTQIAQPADVMRTARSN